MSGNMVFYTLIICHMINQFLFFPSKNVEFLLKCCDNVIVICRPVVSNTLHFTVRVYICHPTVER